MPAASSSSPRPISQFARRKAARRGRRVRDRVRAAGEASCVSCAADLVGRGYAARWCAPCATTAYRAKRRSDSERQNRSPEAWARQEVYKARRKGILKRPSACERCSRRCTPEAHHFAGYHAENALRVRWFCKPCHGEAHRVENAATAYLDSLAAFVRGNWTESFQEVA